MPMTAIASFTHITLVVWLIWLIPCFGGMILGLRG